jgi:hypothetical protein
MRTVRRSSVGDRGEVLNLQDTLSTQHRGALDCILWNAMARV